MSTKTKRAGIFQKEQDFFKPPPSHLAQLLTIIQFSIYNKNDLAIGKRTWDKTTPIRSRIGNYLTRKIYKKATGKTIYDTQSGLRAFSNNLMDYMLNIKGNRYEYEMNVLLNLKDIKVHEIPIQTIYFNNNKGSHFKWFDDSKRVYKVIREYKKQSQNCFFSLTIDLLLHNIYQ